MIKVHECGTIKLKFMKKKRGWMFFFVCLNFIACNDAKVVDEYANIRHEGQKDIKITGIVLDTIYIDASSTSLEGEWHLRDNKLYFIDYSVVGVTEFDLDGQYAAKYIEKGRGPNEILQPIFAGSFSDSGDFVGIDQGWMISLFDKDFKKKNSCVLLGDIAEDEQVWDNLLQNPDPEAFRMYEFFISSKSIRFLNDLVVIPVITEHVAYNGFNKGANTRDFWSRSYNFLMIDVHNCKTGKLFGHYPPIFREKNIPAFSLLSFDTGNGHVYCSYGADSLIYVRDSNGELIKSIGYAASSIKGGYPETQTFEEYSKNRGQNEKDYGYYKRIKLVNDHLFRSYKKDGGAGYGLQIYHNSDLIGDISFPEDIHVIGYSNGAYYGVLPVDTDSERFRIVRFEL